MAQLDHASLRASGYTGFIQQGGQEKVLQFGEGSFLRAFVDDFFDIANERAGSNGRVVVVQPIPQGLTGSINRQQGLYTLYLRGSLEGRPVNEKRVISVLSRCLNAYRDWEAVLAFARSEALEIVVSNTTEAGIVYDPESAFDQTPPASFPAKLTRVLYERWKAARPGVVVLSCELIDDNGRELLRCVNRHIDDWGLPEDFRRWVNEENTFCSTLVDRIVPGRVRDPRELARLNAENGYEDELIDVGEIFGVWIIEGPETLKDRLPFEAAGCPVRVVPDVTPYKKRKVRILNGAHTGFALGAYLAGFDIVRECMHDEVIRAWMDKMLNEEVIPTLPLDPEDCRSFAASVRDRFDNPFVDHELLSISLNSTSKWRARNMPTLLDYAARRGALPPCLTLSLAALLAFYSCDVQELSDQGLVCRRPKGDLYTVRDDRPALEFFYAHRSDAPEDLARAALANDALWGQDLTRVPGLEDEVARILKDIREEGALAAFRACL